MKYRVGDLVVSKNEEAFPGIGKISALEPDSEQVLVSFFYSPLESDADALEVSTQDIKRASLFDERVVYCRNPTTNYWQRARYGGPRPGDRHLIIFRAGEQMEVGLVEIYVPSLTRGRFPSPLHFLKARCTDTPYFSEWRLPFIRSYVDQRAHCRSISAIPSSSVQLEQHQLAVVRRVLQDPTKRYLLADEVGLGKTIEAGLILREQLLVDNRGKTAVVSVPGTLIEQWNQELAQRFHLSGLFGVNLFVVEHECLGEALARHSPEILILDEAHQISPWAWSGDPKVRQAYLDVSECSHSAETCILLSGTPLVGNEIDFLAMLHLLAPKEYSLDEKGIERFMLRVDERERLGGIYQAFVSENDNGSLEDLLKQLVALFPTDARLMSLAESLKPFIDLFSDSSGKKRAAAIEALRRHIGENYRLHQRMLRNRRADPSVAFLFPGLSGAIVKTYHPDGEPYCLEQHLEEFRGEQILGDWDSVAITEGNFREWVALAFVSPLSLKKRAEQARATFGSRISEAEDKVLHDIVELAPVEQASKDEALIAVIEELWESAPGTRLVIFCGETDIADHVYDVCHHQFGSSVERHTQGREIQFVSDEEIRILVCDRSGEDGLNLNGGKKVSVHYSLPISLARIEQRLGRLNRYSSSIYAAPVKSLIVIPAHGVFSKHWFGVLNDAIGIFRKSVASLQYALEGEVDASWHVLSGRGRAAIIDLHDRLVGEDGIIAREEKRVRAQEELNKLDADIQIASEFVDELQVGDAKAEEYVDSMMDWITKGLQFEKRLGDYPGTFRFQYHTGVGGGRRTLVDVPSLIRYCYPALERDQSDPLAPVTVQMSASRDTAAEGRRVHPMRFGSPFIDVIFRFLADDPRGIATALLRYVDAKLNHPRAFLGLTALISKAARDANGAETRRSDELFRPRVIDCWLDQEGNEVTTPEIVGLLERPYKKSHGSGYQDRNIRAELWAELEDYFPDRHWIQTVDKMSKSGVSFVLKRAQRTEGEGDDDLIVEWLGARFVVLIGGLG